MHGALHAGGIQTNLGTGRTELLSPLISRSRSLQTPGASLRDLFATPSSLACICRPLPHWAVPSRLSWGLQPCFCEPGGEVRPSSVEVWLHLQARVQRPVSLGGPRAGGGRSMGSPAPSPCSLTFFFFLSSMFSLLPFLLLHGLSSRPTSSQGVTRSSDPTQAPAEPDHWPP